jgi:hypothetical protein
LERGQALQVSLLVLLVLLFVGLQMGFDEPKPFVYATRDFREYVSSIGILQLVRLSNCLAGFVFLNFLVVSGSPRR